MGFVNNKGSDQPSPISVVVIHLLESIISRLAISAKLKFSS